MGDASQPARNRGAATRAFVTGAVIVLLLMLLALPAISVVADANNWGPFRVGIGPVLIFEQRAEGDGFVASFGPGILLLAIVAGVLNAAGARLLLREDSQGR